MTTVKCIYVSCFKSKIKSLSEILLKAEIDLMKRTFPVVDRTVVVMLDDAQFIYEDRTTWTEFMKEALLWLPSNFRFIISATHSLKGGQESPIEFQFFPKLSRNDFLLSDAEASEFLESVIGLRVEMRSDCLKHIIIRDCAGLVGALRLSVDAIDFKFHRSHPSEIELIRYHFSMESIYMMAQVFGSNHTSPMNDASKNMLAQCFQTKSVQYAEDLSEDEKKFFLTLQKAGILVENIAKEIEFSSPLARRYYIQWLFPNRCASEDTLYL
ncbi:hypothetical protein HK096_000099 [Nowakowskiella sp. JEL0078]|nr:hypothetical protein HK096_000099 [Nowakowskiella sp. JEL0078]